MKYEGKSEKGRDNEREYKDGGDELAQAHLARVFLQDAYFVVTILVILRPKAAQSSSIVVIADNFGIADNPSTCFT
jgi:hypothetical protein